MSAATDEVLSITGEGDIVAVRRAVREAAHGVGFGVTDTTRIVTAASELARNVCKYAGQGTVHLRRVERDGRGGLQLEFEDHGPGIPDVALALEQGYSTSGGLGLGLPGAKRLMDETDIRSDVGCGVTVSVTKWLGS